MEVIENKFKLAYEKNLNIDRWVIFLTHANFNC